MGNLWWHCQENNNCRSKTKIRLLCTFVFKPEEIGQTQGTQSVRKLKKSNGFGLMMYKKAMKELLNKKGRKIEVQNKFHVWEMHQIIKAKYESSRQKEVTVRWLPWRKKLCGKKEKSTSLRDGRAAYHSNAVHKCRNVYIISNI